MEVSNPVELVKQTITHGGKFLMLNDARVRVYSPQGQTVATIVLDDWPDHMQESVIDLIMPYID